MVQVKLILAILMSVWTLFLGGQAWAAATPDAGTVYRELKDQAPSLEDGKPPATPPIKKKVIVPLGDKEDLLVEVKQIQLLGDLPAGIEPAKISAILMEPKAIKRMSELLALAQKIEDYVHETGFPLFRVVVPDQEIFNGRVRMLIYNGRINKVIHVLPTEHRLDDEVIESYFDELIQSGGFKRLDFERTMLLLNDLPGIKVRLILNPGKEPGLLDADVEVTEGRLYRWQVNLDNYGITQTGKNRATAILKVSDLSGVGDRLTVLANASNEPVYAGIVEYKRPFGTQGLIGSVSAVLSDFSITDSASNVGTKGNSQSIEAGLSYPLHLVFGKSLYIDGSIADRDFLTQIDVTTPQKKNIVVGKLGFRGSANDTSMWGYSATNYASYAVYKGTMTPQEGYISTATQDYVKQTLFLARNQALPRGFNLLLSANAQFSNTVLDSSEKLSLGGATAVRAYDPTAIYSNKGFLLSVELGRDLGNAGNYGIIKSSVFFDEGISLSDDVYGGRNVLKGAGFSLALQKWGEYELRMTYAHPVNRSTMGTLSDDRSNSGRVWATLLLFF